MPPIQGGTKSPTLYRCSSNSSISSTASTYMLPAQSKPAANESVSAPADSGRSGADISDDNSRAETSIGGARGDTISGKRDSEEASIRMTAGLSTSLTTEATSSGKPAWAAKLTAAKAPQSRVPASEVDSPKSLYHSSPPASTQDPPRHVTTTKTTITAHNDSMTTAISTSPSANMMDTPHRRPSAPGTPRHRALNNPHHRHHRSTSASSNTSSPRRVSSRTATPLAPPETPQSIKSPPKRLRTESNGPKVLPALYQHCDTKDLVVLIADMLQELVGLNDKLPLSTSGLTRFHSRAPPTISIPDYLARLTFHSSLQPSILLSMVYYIDILSTLYPAFTVTSLTVHRFLITAATVATKGLCDSFLTNSFYAKVGGVSLLELNLLELEFLTRVGWRIVPKGEVLAEYYRSLVGRLNDKYKIEEEPVPLALPPTMTPISTMSADEESSREQRSGPPVAASPASIAETRIQGGEPETSETGGDEKTNEGGSSTDLTEGEEVGGNKKTALERLDCHS